MSNGRNFGLEFKLGAIDRQFSGMEIAFTDNRWSGLSEHALNAPGGRVPPWEKCREKFRALEFFGVRSFVCSAFPPKADLPEAEKAVIRRAGERSFHNPSLYHRSPKGIS